MTTEIEHDLPTVQVFADEINLVFCVYQFSRSESSAWFAGDAVTLPDALALARQVIRDYGFSHELIVHDNARLAAWHVIEGGKGQPTLGPDGVAA